jgi:hypothetical protein
MKKSFVLIVSVSALIIAVLTISAVSGASEIKKKSVSISGTWQLESYKYGPTQSSFIDIQKNRIRLKVINETNFIWVDYDPQTGQVTKSAGGSYTVVGNTYTESLDFGLEMDPYIKQNHVYTVQVEGDMFFLSGQLTPDYKIEEIWKRVK